MKQFDNDDSRAAAVTERSFLARLEGGCQVPIAGHATIEADMIHMTGLVASLDGQTVLKTEGQAPRSEAEGLGIRLAESLLEQGAAEILATLKSKDDI